MPVWNLFDAASAQPIDFLGGLISTSTSSLNATIKDQDSAGQLTFDAYISSVQFNQTSSSGGDLQLFAATRQIGALHFLGSQYQPPYVMTPRGKRKGHGSALDPLGPEAPDPHLFGFPKASCLWRSLRQSLILPLAFLPAAVAPKGRWYKPRCRSQTTAAAVTRKPCRGPSRFGRDPPCARFAPRGFAAPVIG